MTKRNKLRADLITSGGKGHRHQSLDPIHPAFFVSKDASDAFSKWKRKQNKSDARDFPKQAQVSSLYSEAIENGDLDMHLNNISKKLRSLVRNDARDSKQPRKDTKAVKKLSQNALPKHGFENVSAQSLLPGSSIFALPTMVKDFNNHMKDFNTIARELSDTIKPAIEHFTANAPHASGAAASFADFVGILSSLDTRLGAIMGSFKEFIGVGVAIVFGVLMSYAITNRNVALVNLLVFGVSTSLIYHNRADILKRLLAYVSEDESISAQSAGGEAINLISLAKVVSDILSIFSAQTIKGDSSLVDKLSSIYQTISLSSRHGKNFESALGSMLKAVETLVNYVLVNFTSLAPISLQSVANERVESWRVRVQNFLDHAHNNGIGKDLREREYSWNLLSEGRDLKSKLSGEDAAHQRSVIDTYSRALETTIQPLLTAFSSESGDRPEPFVLVLRGPPGVGKSTLMDPICIAALKILRPPGLDFEKDFNLNHHIFTKNGDTPYFDGYRNQPIYKKDEMFQKQDVKGGVTSEPSDFIAMVNSAPYPLNMANLGTKGACYFRSPFIIGTTNIIGRITGLESIREPDAVNRRIKFSVVVSVKPEYTYGNEARDSKLMNALNRSHPELIAAEREKKFCTNCYTFALRDEISDTIAAEGLSYEELMATFQVQFTDHLKRQQDLLTMRNTVPQVDPDKFTRVPIPNPVVPFVMREEGVVAQSSLPRDNALPLATRIMVGMRDEEELVDVIDTKAFRDLLTYFSKGEMDVFTSGAFINLIREGGAHVPIAWSQAGFIDSVVSFIKDGVGPKVDSTLVEAEYALAAVTTYALLLLSDARRLDADAVVGHAREAAQGLTRYSVSYLSSFLTLVTHATMQCASVVIHNTRLDAKDLHLADTQEEKVVRFVATNANAILDKAWPGYSLDRENIIKELLRRLSLEGVMAMFKSDPNKVAVCVACALDSRFVFTHSRVRPMRLIPSKYAQACKDRYVSWATQTEAVKCEKLYDTLKICLVAITSAYAAYKAAFAVRSLVNRVFNDSSEIANAQQGEAYRSFSERRERFKPGTKLDWKTSRAVSAQIRSPNSLFIKRRVYAGMRQMFLGDHAYGFVTCLGRDIFVLPYHYVYQMKWRIKNGECTEHDTLTFKAPADLAMEDITVSVKDFCSGYGLVERDLYLLRMGSGKFGKDILKNFATRASIEQGLYKEAALHTWELGDGGNVHSNTFVGGINLCTMQTYGGEGIPQMNVGPVFQSNFPTEEGDCGAPMIARNVNRNVDYIVGIHVAGSTNPNAKIRHAFSTICTREDMEDMIEGLELKEQSVGAQVRPGGSMRRPMVRAENGKIGLSVFGEEFLNAPYSGPPVNRPAISAIVPSGLDLPWSAEKVPARLRAPPGEAGNDPMKLAVKRYATVPKLALPLSTIKACVQDYFRLIRQEKADTLSDFSPVSIREACMGIPCEDFAKGVSRSSSPGYPFSQWDTVRRAGGKKSFFGSGEDYQFNSADFHIMEGMTKAFLKGEVEYDGASVAAIFQDTLKDELVSKKKFDACKTRLVSACPLHVTIAWRVIALNFVNFYNKARYDVEAAVGVNCVSDEWQYLCNHIIGNSELVQDGDLSGFDTTQHPDIHKMIFDEFMDILGLDSGPYAGARENLLKSYIKSTHVCDSEIYQWPGSLPSGHPMTITFNCMYLCVAYRCAWVANGNALADFRSNVRLVTYGDDSICSVTPRFADSFNHEKIIYGMSTIGLVYTDASKESDGHCPPFKHVSDITFLKRSFDYHDDLGMVVGPLQLSSILERVCWAGRKGDFAELVRDRCDDSLLDLVLHGRDTWEKYGPPIVDAYQRRFGKSLSHTTWDIALLAVRQQMC